MKGGEFLREGIVSRRGGIEFAGQRSVGTMSDHAMSRASSDKVPPSPLLLKSCSNPGGGFLLLLSHSFPPFLHHSLRPSCEVCKRRLNNARMSQMLAYHFHGVSLCFLMFIKGNPVLLWVYTQKLSKFLLLSKLSLLPYL